MVVHVTASTSVVIRTASVDDMHALYTNVVETVARGVGVVMLAGDVGTEAEFAERTRPAIEGVDGGVLLVAEVDGAVVGAISVRRYRPSLVRHLGTLGMEVKPSHQGRGVGWALLTAAQDWARTAGVSRLDLSVRADNARAIRLYERAGFTREFTRQGFVRLPDGTLVDDHGYVKFLA